MMQKRRIAREALPLFMTIVLIVAMGCKQEQTQKATNHKPVAAVFTGDVIWNFDSVPVGELPAGWKVEGTNQKGPWRPGRY